jgi:hypothetical protein
MKSGNKLPVIEQAAIDYAKILGQEIDPYFPPIKTDSGTMGIRWYS